MMVFWSGILPRWNQARAPDRGQLLMVRGRWAYRAQGARRIP